MMHCHILQHMVMGMQTVFAFGNHSAIKAQSAPVDGDYLTYGGWAYGTLLISLLHSTFFDLLKGYPDCDLAFSVDSKWVSAADSIGRNSRISLSWLQRSLVSGTLGAIEGCVA
jgi:hypothetical protein